MSSMLCSRKATIFYDNYKHASHRRAVLTHNSVQSHHDFETIKCIMLIMLWLNEHSYSADKLSTGHSTLHLVSSNLLRKYTDHIHSELSGIILTCILKKGNGLVRFVA